MGLSDGSKPKINCKPNHTGDAETCAVVVKRKRSNPSYIFIVDLQTLHMCVVINQDSQFFS